MAIREGPWKLISTGNKTELFDIPNDPGEAKNLIEEHPEVAVHLREQSRIYWERIATESSANKAN